MLYYTTFVKRDFDEDSSLGNSQNRRYVVFFDIGIGLLMATIVGAVTGSEPSWMLLAVGVTGALWPDADFIVWIMRGKKVDHLTHQHRDLLHRPLVLTPLLTTAVWWLLGWRPGVLFVVTTIAHFTHDTIGHGWGIKWLWPVDNRYWCYRSFGDQPTKLYAWTKQEQDELCEQYGNRQWMQQAYGGLSRSMMLELAMLLAGIGSVGVWYFLTNITGGI